MIDVEIRNYLQANVPGVNNQVYQVLSKDYTGTPQIIYSIEPVNQDNTHGGTSISYRDVLVIDVFAKEADYVAAVGVTQQVDAALASMQKSVLNGHFITTTCPRLRWRLIRSAEQEELIFQRLYTIKHTENE